MAAVLITAVVSLAAGIGIGIRLGDRARAVYREIADWSGERLDAYRKADFANDLDVVRPVTGQQQAVEQ